MKIVMVASESRPYSKTGGLADVVYSLSKELVKIGQKVSIILPLYDNIYKQFDISEFDLVATFRTHMSWRKQTVNVYSVVFEGIYYYFIQSRQYFERGHIYGDFDDGEKFAFFTMAAKEFIFINRLKPDIIHVHDWQTGMLPCLIRSDDLSEEKFGRVKFVLTIHNPAFQGLMPRFALGDFFNMNDELFDNGAVRFKDQVSTLKAGIVFADKITTVSPTHHLELLTPEGGMGLDSVLRYREFDFSGILNGIDYLEFNPQDDPQIAAPFSIRNFRSGKKSNRKALFDKLGMKNNITMPLYSIVSRITWQKGFDIIFPAVEQLIQRGAFFVLLGSGESQYEQKCEELKRRYPDQVGLYIGYSDSLAHLIYAASDFFLMPSLFEPCGLGQMIAQRYGTLPIVRRTGGLRDSVICFDGENVSTANGFGFDAYDAYEMTRTVLYAFDIYQNKTTLNKLIRNAFLTDNSWEKSALEYMEIYKLLI
ncbi:MAG TPA: glycogen synthase [Erysipelotrichaceae bacterium]|nr:glycogen synthase [Erysipelotrichaceae bacterium]